jgi:hypothetical protein
MGGPGTDIVASTHSPAVMVTVDGNANDGNADDGRPARGDNVTPIGIFKERSRHAYGHAGNDLTGYDDNDDTQRRRGGDVALDDVAGTTPERRRRRHISRGAEARTRTAAAASTRPTTPGTSSWLPVTVTLDGVADGRLRRE